MSTSKSPGKSSSYNAEIDILRFCFALMIVFFHILKESEVALRLPLLDGITVTGLKGGYIGTEYFFILSGAFMARHVRKLSGVPIKASESLRYCLKKYKSVLSVLAISVALAMILHDLRAAGDGLYANRPFPLIFLCETLCLQMTGLDPYGYVILSNWYISALLIACLVVYPLCRRFPDAVMSCIGPLTALVLYGHIIRRYGCLCVNWNDFTITYPGVLRAIAGLMLGCFVWKCAERLARVRLTTCGKWLVTGAELMLFGSVWALTTLYGRQREDVLSLLCIALLCVLALSGQSAACGLIPQKPAKFMGQMSRAIYFSHLSVVFFLDEYRLPSQNLSFLVWLLCIFLVAAAVLALSKLMERAAGAIVRKGKSVILAKDA